MHREAGRGGPDADASGTLPGLVSWGYLAASVAAIAASLLLASNSARSFVFDAVALVAGGAALLGIEHNRPARIWPWRFIAIGIILSAAGDVVYDIALRGFGAQSGYPYADLLYLPAYPFLAVALWQLAGPHRR